MTPQDIASRLSEAGIPCENDEGDNSEVMPCYAESDPGEIDFTIFVREDASVVEQEVNELEAVNTSSDEQGLSGEPLYAIRQDNWYIQASGDLAERIAEVFDGAEMTCLLFCP